MLFWLLFNAVLRACATKPKSDSELSLYLRTNILEQSFPCHSAGHSAYSLWRFETLSRVHSLVHYYLLCATISLFFKSHLYLFIFSLYKKRIDSKNNLTCERNHKNCWEKIFLLFLMLEKLWRLIKYPKVEEWYCHLIWKSYSQPPDS